MKTAEEIWNDYAGKDNWASMITKKDFIDAINNQRREQHKATIAACAKDQMVFKEWLMKRIPFESTQEE